MSDDAAASNSTKKESDEVWKNPYLLGFIAVTIITVLPTLLSIIFVCRSPQQFNYWSLFLVEMAVGSLTTEAIVHLLPALILPDKSDKLGVPRYFPYLATVTAGVCVLHALDTASVVFFGRRQSTSHAMEWREKQHAAEAAAAANETGGQSGHNSENRKQQQQQLRAGARSVQGGRKKKKKKQQTKQQRQPQQQPQQQQQQQKQQPKTQQQQHAGSTDDDEEEDDKGDLESWYSDDLSNKFYHRHDEAVSRDSTLTSRADAVSYRSVDQGSVRSLARSVTFGHHRRGSKVNEITISEVIRNPGKCLEPGPYRLCSIISAGSVLHSFADGIAIGAAFAKKWDYGLHLSVSVGMHELAHKVADFAVLTASGFSLKAVLLLNLCYYIANMSGVAISVSLSLKSEELRAWITTIATAVFVYISLVTMSSMVRRNYHSKKIVAFFIGNVGMTVGYLLIMLASLLEFYV